MPCSDDVSKWRFCFTLDSGRPSDPIIKIPYRILEGFPKFSFKDLEPSSVVCSYIIQATDLKYFVDAHFPPFYVSNDRVYRDNKKVLRFPFAGFNADNDFGCGTFFADSIEAEPFVGVLPADPDGRDSPQAAWQKELFCVDGANPPATNTYSEFLRVTVRYSTSRFAAGVKGDPYYDTVTTITGGIDYLHQEPEKMQSDKGDSGANSPVANPTDIADRNVVFAALRPTITHSVNWPYGIEPKWGNICDRLGKLNDKPHDWLPGAAAFECLFAGFSAAPKFMRVDSERGNFAIDAPNNKQPSSGVMLMYDMTFTFIQKFFHSYRLGRISAWRYAWVPKEQDYRRILTRDPQNPTADPDFLYDEEDMTELFRSNA